jgi:hypothetical protein
MPVNQVDPQDLSQFASPNFLILFTQVTSGLIIGKVQSPESKPHLLDEWVNHIDFLNTKVIYKLCKPLKLYTLHYV